MLRVINFSMDTEDLAESRLLADTDEETHAGNSYTQQTPSTSNEPSDIGAAFTLFQSYLDKKLVALKNDLWAETRHTTDFVASKIQETSELSFKYKGNQQQHAVLSQEFKKVQELKQQISARKKLLKTFLNVTRTITDMLYYTENQYASWNHSEL